ncbi:MAG: T9SS type A sorting domain-containing protein, partial [Clostridiales bacterium]
MKKIILPILTLIVLVSSIKTYSQECSECNQRNVIIYDNKMLVPRPDDPSDPELLTKTRKWFSLFYITAGENAAFWQDPSHDCITKFTAAFFTKADTVNESMIFGIDYTNTPPPGPLGGVIQYIIYGAVGGGNGSYTLSLYLEAAQSREVIKTVTINFGEKDEPLTIGKNAYAQLAPLYNTMMEFEKKKRDQGDPWAINPKIVTTPEKTVLKTNESTNVTFQLIDCDGVPLKSRKLTLTTTLGSFDPVSVTTDNEGKASTVFKSGATAGVANISATYPYRRAYEESAMSVSDEGYATIQIERQPYWEVSGSYSYTEKITHDYNADFGSGSTDVMHEESNVNKSHKFNALLDVKQYYSGVYYTDSKPVSFTASGNYTDGSSTVADNKYGSVGFSHESNFSYCAGKPVTSDKNSKMSLNFGIDFRQFNFQLAANMNGGGQRHFISQQIGSEPNNTFETTDCGGADNYSSIDFHARKGGEDTTYTNTETENRADGTVVQSTETVHKVFRENANGTYEMQYFESLKTTETSKTAVSTDNTVTESQITFNGTINSHITTGVNSDEHLIVPKDYLFQNHPNPFNPVTMITYSIAKPGNVKLTIFDLLGREVKTLTDSFQGAGLHSVEFDASMLNSGIYFYTLRTSDFSSSKKMIL